MLKFLVADEDVNLATQYCQYISNYDKMIKTINVNTGVGALNGYNKMKADAMILNSCFLDIKSNEIVDRLSSLNYERKRNNIIITMNSKNENFNFVNTSKICRVFYKPIDFTELFNAVEEIKSSQITETFDEDLLNKILFSMYITIGSYQTEILIDGIKECFDYPYLLDNFDKLLKNLSKKHYTDPENIRNSFRHSLSKLNDKKEKLQNNPVVKMFEPERNISPKAFLDVVVSYLHMQKK